MMARYSRRRTSLRPVNRIKHVVDNSLSGAAAADLTFQIASATDTPTLAATNSVETGSTINGFYIRMEVASNMVAQAGAIPNFYIIIYKNVGGNLATIAPNLVGASDNKRYVIHQEMTMIENTGKGGNPRTIFNGVVVIPRGMRRMGPNDIWLIRMLSPALDFVACVQMHYKEFR